MLGHYERSGRSFPWRETRDPWAILVSEVMLQQTGTERVRPKYDAWMAAYPEPAALAGAKLAEVLSLWSGLGYNRRALALVRAAAALAAREDFPRDEASLLALPGVGPYTARAVLAFAYDVPVVLIETNIRAVFLDRFFPGLSGVPDSRILPLIDATLVREDPRTWYYALMDLGAAIKKEAGNPNARSAHYAKQAPFADSHRRIRGAALRELTRAGTASGDELAARLPFARERVDEALRELVAEGFLEYRGEGFSIGDSGALREEPGE